MIINNRLHFPAIVIISVIAGLSLPLGLYNTIQTNSSTIPVPGRTISNTVFAPLISDKIDPVIYYGNWSALPTDRSTYSLVLDPPTITQDEGLQLASEYLGSSLLSVVEGGFHSASSIWPLWHYVFYNGSMNSNPPDYDLYILISVNTISGVVSQCYEIWSLDFAMSNPDLNPPYQSCDISINESLAEIIAAQYLLDRNYTLPETTRHIETRIEYKSVIGGTENSTNPVYVIELAIPKNGVFPSRDKQGPRFEIDATSGRVLSFSYFLYDLPAFDSLHIIDYKTAMEEVITSVPEFSEGNIFLRLHPNYGILSSFRLTWAFEYDISVSSGIAKEEYYVDAIIGQYIGPTPQFHSGINNRRLVSEFPILLIAPSLITATVGYYFVKRRKT